MNSQEFCYWLQGFFELTDACIIDGKQVKIIKEHLNLVFTKVTLDRSKDAKPALEGNLTLEQWQEILKGKRSPEPFPQYPGVIPGIIPSNPDYIVTCSATGSLEPTKIDPLASPAFLAAFDPESVKLC